MKDEISKQIISTVMQFVNQDVAPIVNELEDKDIYPTNLADKMTELGLFGINIPEECGGLGLSFKTLSEIFIELNESIQSEIIKYLSKESIVYILKNLDSDDAIKILENIDEKNKNAILSRKGIDKIEQLSIQYGILKNNNLIKIK